MIMIIINSEVQEVLEVQEVKSNDEVLPGSLEVLDLILKISRVKTKISALSNVIVIMLPLLTILRCITCTRTNIGYD